MFGYGARLSMLAAAALFAAGKTTTLPDYKTPTRLDADNHVRKWLRHTWKVEAEMRQASQIAAKRERDAPWINAAEAKRARKRAKALSRMEGRKDG